MAPGTQKSLSAANPSVGMAQFTKKSRASSKVSDLCDVVIITSSRLGPTYNFSSNSSPTTSSSTMSSNLWQSGPQAQKYTMPCLSAACANADSTSIDA